MERVVRGCGGIVLRMYFRVLVIGLEDGLWDGVVLIVVLLRVSMSVVVGFQVISEAIHRWASLQ